MRANAFAMTVISISVLMGCSGTGNVSDSSPSDVESRGVPKAQRPVQPGANIAPPASAQEKFQLPTWPQKFEVQGPEVASFGFAVTQPGPITVDVQGQGAPVLVTLQSSGRQPITQPALGGLRMSYNVTPQDVQRGVLWTVNLALPPNTQGRTTGQVRVQYPPVNEAQAEAAVRMRLEKSKQQGQVDPAQIQARRQALLEARRGQLDRQLQEYLKGTELQLEAFLKQQQAQGKIRSRGLGQPGVLHETPTTPQMRAMPTGPHIDKLSVMQGPPGTTVIIQGTGFTDFVGTVSVTTPTGSVLASVLGDAQPIWADGFIAVRVPDLTRVLPYTANISVHLDFERFGLVESNPVPFNFVPRQEVRVVTRITDDHRLADPSYGAYPAFTKDDSVHHTRISPWLGWPLNASPFFGVKEKDYFFEKTQLKNGWKLDCVQILPYEPQMCAPAPGPTTITAYNVPPGSGAYADAISSPGSGLGTARPKFYVTWWLEAFIPAMQYSYAMTISGPAGTSDGIEVP